MDQGQARSSRTTGRCLSCAWLYQVVVVGRGGIIYAVGFYPHLQKEKLAAMSFVRSAQAAAQQASSSAFSALQVPLHRTRGLWATVTVSDWKDLGLERPSKPSDVG